MKSLGDKKSEKKWKWCFDGMPDFIGVPFVIFFVFILVLKAAA
jgi:hypothetical protein